MVVVVVGGKCWIYAGFRRGGLRANLLLVLTPTMDTTNYLPRVFALCSRCGYKGVYTVLPYEEWHPGYWIRCRYCKWVKLITNGEYKGLTSEAGLMHIETEYCGTSD